MWIEARSIMALKIDPRVGLSLIAFGKGVTQRVSEPPCLSLREAR